MMRSKSNERRQKLRINQGKGVKIRKLKDIKNVQELKGLKNTEISVSTQRFIFYAKAKNIT